jgi:hypothetical protein
MYETANSPASNHPRDARTLFCSAQNQAYYAAMPRKLVWITVTGKQLKSPSEPFLA